MQLAPLLWVGQLASKKGVKSGDGTTPEQVSGSNTQSRQIGQLKWAQNISVGIRVCGRVDSLPGDGTPAVMEPQQIKSLVQAGRVGITGI